MLLLLKIIENLMLWTFFEVKFCIVDITKF